MFGATTASGVGKIAATRAIFTGALVLACGQAGVVVPHTLAVVGAAAAVIATNIGGVVESEQGTHGFRLIVASALVGGGFTQRLRVFPTLAA